MGEASEDELRCERDDERRVEHQTVKKERSGAEGDAGRQRRADEEGDTNPDRTKCEG